MFLLDLDNEVENIGNIYCLLALFFVIPVISTQLHSGFFDHRPWLILGLVFLCGLLIKSLGYKRGD